MPRTCYECRNDLLCKLRWSIERAIDAHIPMLNLSRESTKCSKTHVDIYQTVAQACLHFSGRTPGQ